MVSAMGTNMHPHEMDWTFDNGLYNQFMQWKRRCESLLKSFYASADDGAKVCYVEVWGGSEMTNLIDLWKSKGKLKEDEKDLDKYWKLFEEYCKPKCSELIAMVELRDLRQGSLPFNEFYRQAKKLVDDAGFEGRMAERMLRDTIIYGLSDKEIRDKIIKTSDDKVTLNKVMQIARAEYATHRSCQFFNNDKVTVNLVQKGRFNKGSNWKKQGDKKPFPSGTVQGNNPKQDGQKCYKCGKGRHMSGQACPAKDATCNFCKKKGHFRAVCRAALRSNSNSNHSASSNGRVNLVASSGNPVNPVPIEQQSLMYVDPDGQPVYTYGNCNMVNSIKSNSKTDKCIINFPIGTHYSKTTKNVELQADTGADLNLMNEYTFNELFPDEHYDPNSGIVESYGKMTVPVIGNFDAYLSWKVKVYKQNFKVT